MFEQNIPEIKLDGFKVVSKEMLHDAARQPISCKFTTHNITFAKSAIVSLGTCERIRIEINTDTKQLLAIPVTQNDKDNVRWIKGVKDPTPRVIECIKFTNQIFDLWEWDKEYYYRALGKLVSSDKKLMLLFDFENAEKIAKKAKG